MAIHYHGSQNRVEFLDPFRDLVGNKLLCFRIDDLDGLRRRFVAEGVFVRPFGSVVYVTPAFTIGDEELAKLTTSIVKVLRER